MSHQQVTIADFETVVMLMSKTSLLPSCLPRKILTTLVPTHREMWPSQADASVVPEVTPTSGPAHLRRMRERTRLPHGEAWTDVNLAVSGRLSQLFNLNESPWARFT